VEQFYRQALHPCSGDLRGGLAAYLGPRFG